jgi:cytochrome o ubiquinol oxidase subunit IV
MTPREEPEYGTYKSYAFGFFVCIVLTLASYFVKQEHLFSGPSLFIALVLLGLVQAVIQLFLFLHIADEPKPRYNLVVFLFMLLVLTIIFFGTLWIMYNLNYRIMGT